MPAATSKRFTLRQLFVFVACVAVLLAGARWLWLGVQEARRAARRSIGAGHAFQAIYALHSLEERSPHLPYAVQRRDNSDPNSEALYSWRVLVSKAFQLSRAPNLNARWDSPTNSGLSGWTVDIFCWRPEGPATNTTNLLAITGPGTAFGDGASPPHSLKKIPGDTILIVETRNSGLHWMEPGDFDIRTMPRTINAADGTGISGCHRGGFFVAFADSRYWWLSNETPFENLELFFTLQGAEANDREELLGPYRRQ